VKRLALLLLLLLPAWVWGQIPGAIRLGEGVNQEALDKAQKLIDGAKAGEKWDVGQFQIFERGSTIKTKPGTKLLLKLSDPTVLALRTVPAGVVLMIDGTRVGDTGIKEYEFPPQPDDYWRLKATKNGTSWVTVLGISEDGNSIVTVVEKLITIGAGPQPPPTPPGPQPPEPQPPNPPPIPTQGLRVLIVLESKDLSNLPSSQISAINAREVREYMNLKCAKDGNQPEWRVYDQQTNVTRESKVWQDAMARPRQSLPWIVISNGVDGFEGPLPVNVAELMKKLKQYGGN